MFLMIDEFDEMYRINKGEDPQAAANARQTLAQLRRLGDNTSSRYFTAICGSSPSLPSLLQAQGDVVDKDRFPLTLLDLGRQAYPQLALSEPGLPSYDSVVKMVGHLRGDFGNERDFGKFVKEVTFFTGGHLSLLQPYLHDSQAFFKKKISGAFANRGGLTSLQSRVPNHLRPSQRDTQALPGQNRFWRILGPCFTQQASTEGAASPRQVGDLESRQGKG